MWFKKADPSIGVEVGCWSGVWLGVDRVNEFTITVEFWYNIYENNFENLKRTSLVQFFTVHLRYEKHSSLKFLLSCRCLNF